VAQVLVTEKIKSVEIRAGAGSLREVVLFLLLVGLALLAIFRLSPPPAVSAQAPATDFSSGRAMRHLKAISARPHPLGTDAHAEARDYLLAELRAAGLEPQVQRTTVVDPAWNGPIRAATVQNVLARLEGTESTKAVMLVSHYDSANTSPGASDDGAGVAALLETLRALKAGPPLKNDLIFLFTDAEEVGLLGATAFVEEHPWSRDVGLVLNFEARGNGGASTMFETSSDNGWLIEEFAKAAPHPVAHSLAYEIYKLLPNDTDLTIFRNAGLPGLNFAYVGGVTHYHTLLDNVAEIDQRSLQHHGTYALSLARQFGNLPLDAARQRRGGDAVYFDILGLFLVRYSSLWILPLAVFNTALFVALLTVGWRRRRLTLRGVALGFMALLSCLILSALVTTLLWAILRRLDRAAGMMSAGVYNGALYVACFAALTVGIVAAFYVLLLRRKLGVEALTAGALLCWLILMWAASVSLPGASYLFAWPLLFGLIALATVLIPVGERRASPAMLVTLLICAVPGIVLVSPVAYQVYLGLGMSWAAVVTALVVLLCGLLVPHLHLITLRRRWLPSGAGALLAATLMAAAIATSGFDASRRRPNSLFYGLNADTGKAVWASGDARADEWTAQFLSVEPRTGALPDLFNVNSRNAFLQGDAPAIQVAPPEVELLEDRASGGVRTVRVRVSSPRRASVVTVFLNSGAEVLSSSVGGRRLDLRQGANVARRKQWGLRYYGFPQEGVEVVWEVEPEHALELRVVDQTYELPVIHTQNFKARPDSMMPAPVPFTDSTYVSRVVNF
jgi:Peptidase family M28